MMKFSYPSIFDILDSIFCGSLFLASVVCRLASALWLYAPANTFLAARHMRAVPGK
jgi:hypothetical protein